jgi:hypothetical protein
MSATVTVPVRSAHHRRPFLWLTAALLAAIGFAVGIQIVDDRSTDSAVETRAPTGLVPTIAETACSSPYAFLLAAMAKSMSPEAVDRIVPVLSADTRTGIRNTAEAMGLTSCLAPTPDGDGLAWALARLTPPERAAIVAELPPAMREAVADGALKA